MPVLSMLSTNQLCVKKYIMSSGIRVKKVPAITIASSRFLPTTE